MPKYILSVLAVVTLLSSPAAAQDAPVETSFELGGTYSDSITFKDNGSVLTLNDVKTLDFGLKAERQLVRRDNLNLSGALSGQASFGEGDTSQQNGLTQTGDVNFSRVGAYADLIARIEGQDEKDWTPFFSAGAGVRQDRARLDNQVFKDLTPVGRVRAGLEKKVNDKATFGIGVGQTFKLD